MTEKEYYLWSNKFNNWFIHVNGAAFLTNIYIAAFVFEFCNCTNYELMQAANENKQK